jgi:hypothetical protein
MKDAFDILEIEDLTPDLKLIADTCGLEPTKSLLRTLSGMYLYIPKISRLEPLIQRYIKIFPDKNYKVLASELNVSEVFLKKVAQKKYISKN